MGHYTHYWRIPSTINWLQTWPQLVANAQRIVDAADVPLNYNGEEHQPAVINVEKGIHLNGADDSHESFILKPEATRFKFCKTARKPYDIVVASILLRASMLAGKAISVSSDGDWYDDWNDASCLVMQLWPGEEVDCPWDGSESEDEGD